MSNHEQLARRNFVKFLAASPLLSAAPSFAQQLLESTQGTLHFSTLDFVDRLIESADEAQNTLEFEQLAAQKIAPAHYGYVAGGAGDGSTLKANRLAYQNYHLRPRRLAGIGAVDASGAILGDPFSSPIMISPCGGMMALDALGEVAVSRASNQRGMIQMHSTMASFAIEDVAAPRSTALWYQLYAITSWDYVAPMVQRAVDAGCKTVLLTVDTPARGTPEIQNMLTRFDPRECAECHGPQFTFARKPMVAGAGLNADTMRPWVYGWDLLERLKREFDINLVIKGIETAEDANDSIAAGVDAIMVSNHGGRAMAGGRGTVDALPEVVAAVDGRVPVIMDGGIRRGHEALIALCLGANAVGIGRAYLWGLAAFGEEGAGKVMDLLNSELKAAMKNTGIASYADISAQYVGRN